MLLPEHVTVSQQLETSGNEVFLTRKSFNASKMIIRQKSGNSEGFSDSKNKNLLPLITYINTVQITSAIRVLNTKALAIYLPLNDEIYTEGRGQQGEAKQKFLFTSQEFCILDILFSEPGACSSERKVISNLLHCARQCVVPVTVTYSYCITTEEEVIFLTGAYLPDFFMTINVNLALVHQAEH